VKPKEFQAEVLRAARKAAGFASAADAAKQNGWSTATYRAQEAGSRRIHPKDASVYEKAFGIRQGSLFEESGYLLRELIQNSALKEQERTILNYRNKQATAFRLKLARILRGHVSAAAFVDKNKLKGPTYASHEAGTNTISPEYADLYATALGLEKHWLLTGTLPSALGAKVDAHIAEWSKIPHFDVRPWVDLADPALPVDTSKVAEAKRRAEQIGLPSLEIRELPPNVIADESLADATRNYQSRWRIPADLLDVLGKDSTNSNVVALAVEKPASDLKVGDRIFVDTRDTDMDKPGLFACLADAELRIVNVPSPARRRGKPRSSLRPLGRIVGMFKRVQ
jgi:hypothetical protein